MLSRDKIWLIITSVLLVLFIMATVVLGIVVGKIGNSGNSNAPTVSACDYEACGDNVFSANNIYLGVGIITEHQSIFGKIVKIPIRVPMAIEIHTVNKKQKTPYGSGTNNYYTGEFVLYKHDGGPPPHKEFYFTYGGCLENYFYDPASCKFSYTKSGCTLDKELPPVDKKGAGTAPNCCSGNCKGHHSGANTILRNIEYNGKTDTFSITLYNNDSKKAITFDLNKHPGGWPQYWPTGDKKKIPVFPRDRTTLSYGCTWNDGKCGCN